VVLERGWQDSYLTWLKGIYKKRVTVMWEALEQYLPDGVSFQVPSGGFFFWLSLPQEIEPSDLLARAREYQVGFQPGIKFSSTQGLGNYLRLSFAYYDEGEIRKGIERLGKVLTGAGDRGR